MVSLRQMIARIHQHVRKVTVIGQDDQSAGIVVQSANRIDPGIGIDKIGDLLSVVFIISRGNVLSRPRKPARLPDPALYRML